jgi:hypothetical protein
MSSKLKVFICALSALICGSQMLRAADQIVEATIVVTNFSGIATNGTATLTVNSATRTATNNVSSSPATLFLGTNSMLPAKTNLYNHIALYPFGSAGTRLTLINIGTNSFKLRGQVNQAIAGAIAGNWGTFALSTNTITNFTAVTVPLEYYSAGEATNIASELTRFFSLAGNAVAAAATGLSNHLNQFMHQVASNKLFFASTNRSGAVQNAMQITGTNVAITNVVIFLVDISGVTNLAGFLRALTNGYLTNVVIETDMTNRFGRILIPPSGGITMGSTSSPPGFVQGLQVVGQAPTMYLNAFSDTAQNKPLLLLQRARGGEGNPTNTLAGDSIGVIEMVPRGLTIYRRGLKITADAIGDTTDTSSSTLATFQVGKTNSGVAYHVALAFTADVSTNNTTLYLNSNLVANAAAFFADLRASGGALTNVSIYSPTNWSTNLFALGGVISNMNLSHSTVSNVAFASGSTNVFSAGSDISFGRSTITTVANGHNTINVGTNVYVDLTGSPSAAWTWGGITGGNRDGKYLKVRNSTGWPADILHNSGTEPTASLRISTPTLTNTVLNNLGTADFLYDPSAQRWILFNVFNTATPAASATNALATLSSNGVLVTSAWTNLNIIYGSGLTFLTTNTSGKVDMEIRGLGYTLAIGSAGSQSPADSTTYYFGSDWNANANTTWNLTSVEIPKSGTLKRVFIKVRNAGTLSSGEAVSHYIRINDTTDVTVNTTATYDTTATNIVNSALSTAVVAGDMVNLKIATPAWVTNPTSVRVSAILYIE